VTATRYRETLQVIQAGKDRFARGPKPFDGRTDGGANDLGIELVVMMADQVAHTGHIGPRHIRVALTQTQR
jgi:hypothetical protein